MIGLAQSHFSLKVGVGSLCGFFRVRLPLCVLLCGRLGVGTRLACGAAHGYGVAATTVAKTMAAIASFIVNVGARNGDEADVGR